MGEDELATRSTAGVCMADDSVALSQDRSSSSVVTGKSLPSEPGDQRCQWRRAGWVMGAEDRPHMLPRLR